MRLSYTNQNSAQTLEQGLEEFYQANPHFSRRENNEPIDNFIKNHDIIHVVFGLSTAIEDEMLADFSAMFCSDIGAMSYMSNLKLVMNDANLIEGIKNDPQINEQGWLKTIWLLIKTVPAVFTLFIRGWRMKKKWHWSDYDCYKNRTLADIRTQFKILVPPWHQLDDE